MVAACAPARGAVQAKERTFLIEGSAGRLHVSDGGEGGPAVVFVQGMRGSVDAWREALEHLRSSRRAVALELRGHGLSQAPRNGDFSIEALADDVDSVAVALGLERFYLVGHSLAGLVLTAYTGQHPEKVAGLPFVDALAEGTRLPRSPEASSFDRPQMMEWFNRMLARCAR